MSVRENGILLKSEVNFLVIMFFVRVLIYVGVFIWGLVLNFI